MKEVGYYNGTFGPLEKMQIPMLDRACYFGDGVYDFSLAYNGKIFALDEHVDRIYRSASMIEIEIPYTKEEMKALIDKWQSMDETVVFTNGCFDILHRGHITYLQEAAQLGAHLIIGLNSDASVRRLKGETRPIVSEEDRAALLSALQCIDGVVLFEEDTPAELLAYLRPNILVKGGDYKKEDIVGRESVDEVEVLSFKEGYSTSDIVKKIATMAKEGKL